MRDGPTLQYGEFPNSDDGGHLQDLGYIYMFCAFLKNS